MSDEAIINEINEILVYLEDEGEYHLDKDCDTEWLLAVKEVLNLFNRQQERIEELEIITGLANNRKYYRKFVDEVFCKQKGNELSEPDFDYIYQLYFEQQAEIEKLKWEKDHFEFKVDDLNGKLEKFKEYRDIKNGAYEREIEKLQAEIDDLKRDAIPKLQDSLNRANKSGIKLERENARLKAEIKKMQKYNAYVAFEQYNKGRTEAIKEFAERLKAKVDLDWDNSVDVEDIDRLVAEMVGEQNA